MAKIYGVVTLVALTMGIGCAAGHAQNAPPSPDRAWHANAEKSLDRELKSRPDAKYDIDPRHRYTLAELIDLAQHHNPETRVAWEQAIARAASLGVARSALFPTVAAVALASTIRQAILIEESFHRQTLGIFQPRCMLNIWS